HNAPQDACAAPLFAAACCSLLLLHKNFVRQQRFFPSTLKICCTTLLQAACSNLGLLQACCKMQQAEEAVSCGFCVDVKVQETYSVARMFELCGSNFQTKWTKKCANMHQVKGFGQEKAPHP